MERGRLPPLFFCDFSSSVVTSCSWTPHKSQVFIDKFDPCAILAQDAYCQKWRIFKRAAHVKFPVVSSARHKGKTIEIDPSKEVITLVGINGEPMGSLAWDFLVDQILTYRKPPQSREARSEPRISLSIRVKYQTPEGTPFESRAGGIGGGGLFIESFTPLGCRNQTCHGVYVTRKPERMAVGKRRHCLGLSESRPVHIQPRHGRTLY